MKRLTFEEFMRYSYHYVNHDERHLSQSAKSLIEFVMHYQDKWLYIENSFFFLLHVMGLEVYLEDDRLIFYEENKLIFPEISCGDRLLAVNGHHPFDDEVYMLHMHCKDIRLLIETSNSIVKEIVFRLPIVEQTQNIGNVFHHVNESVGYIKINTFSQINDAELSCFLHNKSRLIIDLTECGGGPINQMLKFCEFFAPEGGMVLPVVDFAGVKHHRKIPNHNNSSFLLNSVDFLVSSATASSAEMFCLLLREKYSGVIFGAKTAGKLVVHEYIDVDGQVLALPIYKLDHHLLAFFDGPVRFSGMSILPDIPCTINRNR